MASHRAPVVAASLLATFFCMTIIPVYAEEEQADPPPNFKEETLTGGWGGLRPSLYKAGIDFTIVHKSDVWSNTSGGIKRGTNWMGYTEAGMNVDLEKLLGWESTTAYVHFHSELGTQFNEKYVGAFLGMDNIETAKNTGQFNNIWIQKNFNHDRFSVLAGLYAVDSEFGVTDSSLLFIQPPYGPANDWAQASLNAPQAPAVYPVGALSLRLKYTLPEKGVYAMYALSDGVPGDPDTPRGTHVQLNDKDGTLSMFEIGLVPAESGEDSASGEEDEAETYDKTAIGFWRYSGKLDDPVDVDANGDPRKRRAQGVYFLAEHTLFQKNGKGLTGFFRAGTASHQIYQSDWTVSLGLRYKGMLDSRPKDVAGVAFTYNHASDTYRSMSSGTELHQSQLEVTYQARITDWFALQPTLHYIVNPNMDPALDNVWIVGARAELAF